MAAGGAIAVVAKRLLFVDGAAPAGATGRCFCFPSLRPRPFSSGRKVVPFSEHSRPGRRRGRRSSWSGGGAFLCPMGLSVSSSSSSQAPDGGLQGLLCPDTPSFLDGSFDAGKSDYASVSDEEWKKRLTKEQYYITRQKGTERAFTGEYWNTKTPGTFHCVCCDTPLFGSKTKFDSGTGWPSYYAPVGNNVKSKLDLSIIFMPRQEVLCAVCDAHLGHVFDDGPPPTGKRYCINSASLKLKPQ